MTDPNTSYEKKDEIRAVINDRVATIYKISLGVLPMAVMALLSAGAALWQINDHERRIAQLTSEMRLVERVSTRTETLVERQSEDIREMKRLLETLNRNLNGE